MGVFTILPINNLAPAKAVKALGRAPLVLALLLAACATANPPAEPRAPEPFTLPVLTMAELHRLVEETVASAEDDLSQPRAIARILCGAKGYRPSGDKFATCHQRLVKAVAAQPEVLAQTRALARIAKKYAEVRVPKRRPPAGMVSKSGRPPPCYDLATARLVVCEDI
jgi:hypothetical protein